MKLFPALLPLACLAIASMHASGETVAARRQSDDRWQVPGSEVASAVTATWKDAAFTDGNWETAGNWYNGIPGAAGTNSNTDTAKFSYTANLSVMLNAARSLANIDFIAGAGSFTIRGSAINLASSGSIYLQNGVSNIETVSNPVFLTTISGGGGSLFSDSTNSGALLVIGGDVTGRQPSATISTLELGGQGKGVVGGIISDGTTGKVAVVKDGSGAWTLNGANQYTGTTSVTVGTLLINGNQSMATGAVSVAAGSVLGGTGAIGGTVTINSGGTITGGTIGSVGALTLASTATFSGASTKLASLSVDLLGSTSDLLAISGTLDLTSAYDQIVFSGATNGTASYAIATYGSVVGTFSNMPNLPAGYHLVYGLNELDLVSLAAVPEPSTGVIGVLGLLAIGWTQRRRFRPARRKNQAAC